MANEVIFMKHLVICLLLTSAGASKLNVVRVLLPVFDDISTNFTLYSTDDYCLRWTTTRDDVVRLSPCGYNEELDCSPSVVITTNTKDRHRLTADIFAEDPVTKQVVRCVVITDAIHSLAITTKTRELIFEEAPEIFEVRAYDNHGNEFSTLAGVPLNWIISSMGSVKDTPVLKITPFKDSSYGTPDSVKELEEQGMWGDKVLLEGLKTGMSKVTVKLTNDLSYGHVKSNEIILSVIANLMVLPPEVYIMVGDVVKFRVIQTSYGKMEEIDLSSSQYYLKVVDGTVAGTQHENGVIKGLALGETKLYLHDSNIAISSNSDVFLPMPSAVIKVVKPAYMMLTLMPYKNWITVVSQRHDILAEIFTENDRKLTLGPGVSIHTTVGENFHVQERSTNGSWQTGWTECEGVATVTAVLDGDDSLQASGEIIIYPKIVLTPSEVILPWDPSVRPKYDIDLKATGGDGKFIWSSTNNTVGIVTQFGRVHTHNMGSFEISAAMQKNHYNRVTAKFHILPPSKLEIVEFVMEAEVGTLIYLHVALYVDKESFYGSTGSQIPVTRCQDLNFKVRTTDPKFIYRKHSFIDTIGTACGNIAIFSSEVGTGKVTVSYQLGETTLQDSVTLTFFKPLKLLKPTGTILLAVGSATNLIFTGGPRSRSGTQQIEIETSDEDYVKTTDVTSKHQMPSEDEYTVVHVLCRKLGHSNVTMSIVNPPLIANCHNNEASTTVLVICGKPRKLEIQPEIKVADANSCPMDLSSERVVVQSDAQIDLIIKVLDGEGREFLNVSSLNFVFSTRPGDKAEIGEPLDVYESTGIIGSAVYANKSYQKVIPKIETGEILFMASITGYNDNVLRLNKIKAECPDFADETDDLPSYVPINASITLLLVDDTVVTPNEISIYNHPSNKLQIDVKQGSGYYSISMTKDDVVHVKYMDNSRQLDITPVSNGIVSIKLTDLCLVNKPAQIDVNVVSIGSIRAEMSDKVELGKCITCTVSLHDESGSLMNIPNLDLIEMNHLMDNHIGNIERLVTPSSSVSGRIEYVISGTELGDTKLIFFIGDPDFDGYVVSDPLELQVFPSLKIQPRVMTLAVGAVLQYTCKGGPQPFSEMEYRADDDKTTTICAHGVATGLVVGKAKVSGRAVGSTASGQKIIYTEDTAELQVINLSGVKITAPATKVKVGAKIPLWASGRPDQITPLILATIKPPIMFSWCVQDAHIARIYDVVENSKVDGPSPNLPFVRLKALKAGSTMVSLNATVVRNKKLIIYASTIEIDIVDPIELVEPRKISENSIYITPNSQTQLRTNAEEHDFEIAYNLMSDTPISTEIQYKSPISMNIVQVSRTGLVSSNAVVGRAIVLATSIDTAGTRQSMIIPVEVKSLHYMMLTMGGSWKLASHGVYSVPLGSEFEITVQYFDSLGNKLIASGIETSVKASRNDLTTIHKKSNDTFTISTKKKGITVLQVYSECNDKVTDYVKLNVTQVINPYDTELIVGDVVCYHTPVKMDTEYKWSSSDPSILLIDEKTGIAIAVAVGKATIFHTYHMASPVQVTVSPIGSLQLVAHNTTFTNTQEFRLYMTLLSPDHPRVDNLLTGYDCAEHFCCIQVPSPLHCVLTLDNSAVSSDLFDITAKFDIQRGMHYCSIMPTSDAIQKGHSLPKSDALLTITSCACESGLKKVKLNFVPGVQKPENVKLDGNTFEGSLVVYGAPEALTSLTVKSRDESALWVGDRQQEGSKLTFTVSLQNSENVEMHQGLLWLDLEAEKSAQQLSVGVQLEEGAGSGVCGKPERSLLAVLHSNRFVLTVILGFILIITLCTYTYLNYIQTQQSINVNVLAPSSPTRSLNLSGSISPTMAMCDPTRGSPTMDTSCYCTRSPEIRRNRRFL